MQLAHTNSLKMSIAALLLSGVFSQMHRGGFHPAPSAASPMFQMAPDIDVSHAQTHHSNSTRHIIGKPVQQLLRTSTGANVYPPEITKLVSLRFTFAVTMTKQSYYKPRKTYNVVALVTSHGQPIAIPPNAAHDHGENESGAESGNSSGDQNARGLSATGTPNNTQTSPSLLQIQFMTPPPSLGGLETPVTKKHQRGESSKTNMHPSCRRRLIQEASDDDTAAADIPVSSATTRNIDGAQGDDSSEGHSAQESG